MLEFLFHAHSGLRYLVLLSALVAIGVLAWGLTSGRPYGRPARIAASSFTGLLYLQMLIGIAMVALGYFYPSLLGHIFMMLLGAVAAQVLIIAGRKQANARKGYSLSLAGVVIALLLILGGIAAIGRGPFESRDGPGAPAADEAPAAMIVDDGRPA